MTKSLLSCQALVLLALCSFCLLSPAVCAEVSLEHDKAKTAEPAEPSTETLQKAVDAYKADPGEVTWAAVIEALKNWLAASRLESVALLKATPAVSLLSPRILEAGPVRIWSFPGIAQSKAALLQWHESKTVMVPGRRRRVAQTVVSSRMQLLGIPTGIVLKDARIVDIPARNIEARHAAEAGKAEEVKAKPDSGRFLILAGNDQNGNRMWLESFRLGPEGFQQNAEPFAFIPPYLLNNLSGSVGFSGSEIVLTVRTNSKEQAAAASYKLALRLVGGRYALEGEPAEDTPFNTVYQFVHAIGQGRVDLAKGWLADPTTSNIPKYIGLTGKAATAAMKIINMSGPPAGIYRYRLVTFDKDDLVFDVYKPKVQWAIKGIFIAPADPLIEKIARDSALPPVDKPKAAESSKTGAAETPGKSAARLPGMPKVPPGTHASKSSTKAKTR